MFGPILIAAMDSVFGPLIFFSGLLKLSIIHCGEKLPCNRLIVVYVSQQSQVLCFIYRSQVLRHHKFTVAC